MKKIYLVGSLNYDYEEVFEVVYATDDLEMAINHLNTMTDKNSAIKEYELNTNYTYLEAEKIVERYCDWEGKVKCKNYFIRVVEKQVKECVNDIYKYLTKETIKKVASHDWDDGGEIADKVYKIIDERIEAHALEHYTYKVYEEIGLDY